MASRYAFSLMNNSNSIRAIQTRLALSAFLLLFVELALIRWLGANVIYLAYFSIEIAYMIIILRYFGMAVLCSYEANHIYTISQIPAKTANW